MLFDLKSVLLFGLVAISSAAPIAEGASELFEERSLEARAQVPATINCGGTTWTADQIKAAIKESKTQHGKYPEKFGNKSGKTTVFSNIPATTQLWEEPLTNPHWAGGEPGKVRVVMNNNFQYVGLMTHTGSALAGTFAKC